MTQFLLRYCSGLAGLADGDLLKGLILAAILDANVAPLVDTPLGAHRLANLNDTVPDDLRAPISVSALSRTLNVPYETTRRHVARLIEEGVCARTDKGVYVRGEWISGHRDVTATLYASLKLMLRTLDKAGFDLAAMAGNDLSADERNLLRA